MTQTKTKAPKRPIKLLRGNVEPRIHTPYLKGNSKADELIEFCTKIGRELMPWQKHVLKDMLSI
jgi:hypothetical protein